MNNFEIIYDTIESPKKAYKRRRRKISYLYIFLGVFIIVNCYLWFNTKRKIEEINKNYQATDIEIKELKKELSSVISRRDSFRFEKKEKEDKKVLLDFQIKILLKNISEQKNILSELRGST